MSSLVNGAHKISFHLTQGYTGLFCDIIITTIFAMPHNSLLESFHQYVTGCVVLFHKSHQKHIGISIDDNDLFYDLIDT